jgi:hypothetical protein
VVPTERPADASPAQSPADLGAGLTEAEKMRQRIMQRKAAAASLGGSPAHSPDVARQSQQAEIVSTSASGASGAGAGGEEDYEEMMRRRRAESILKKKEDEKQERKNIIKAFHEKAKEKGIYIYIYLFFSYYIISK